MSKVCGRSQKSASAVVPGCGDDRFSAKTIGMKQINVLRNIVANMSFPGALLSERAIFQDKKLR
jgi:hypothetical protein